jgi:hypothetical protein
LATSPQNHRAEAIAADIRATGGAVQFFGLTKLIRPC